MDSWNGVSERSCDCRFDRPLDGKINRPRRLCTEISPYVRRCISTEGSMYETLKGTSLSIFTEASRQPSYIEKHATNLL
jgi:hypothetical protein